MIGIEKNLMLEFILRRNICKCKRNRYAMKKQFIFLTSEKIFNIKYIIFDCDFPETTLTLENSYLSNESTYNENL